MFVPGRSFTGRSDRKGTRKYRREVQEALDLSFNPDISRLLIRLIIECRTLAVTHKITQS